VYDSADALVHGGLGIDVLLSGNDSTHLDALLNGGKVQDVEVLVRGTGAESLTSLGELAGKGIEVNGNSVELTGWTQGETRTSGDVTVTTWTQGDLTIETNLAAEQIILQSNTGSM